MGLKRDIGEKGWSLSRGKGDGGGGSDDETGDEAEVSSMAEAVEMKKKVRTVSCRRFAMNWGFGKERESFWGVRGRERGLKVVVVEWTRAQLLLYERNEKRLGWLQRPLEFLCLRSDQNDLDILVERRFCPVERVQLGTSLAHRDQLTKLSQLFDEWTR